VTVAFWAWRNRYKLLDWLGFGLRAAGDASQGHGLDDARAELRLRSSLARDPATRSLAIEVRVERGVCTLRGRVSPETHARVQDKAAAVPGIRRIDDRLVNVSLRSRRLRLRAA
jgi:osmotically-inducible protein OsmY